jgi:acyl-CoA reductase-like NAD-dependent aldehyde dehydrogenase
LNPKIKGLQVYGHDSWAKEYIDTVRSTKTKFVFEGPGNCPFIVLRNANVKKAAEGAVASGIKLNSGQICMSSERFYVDEEVFENFLEEVLKEIESLKVGDPRDEKTDVGPLGSARAAANIKSQLEDSIKKGAKVEVGNKAEVFHLNGLETYLVYPTVLTKINHNIKIMKEETFGPIIPIQTFNETRGAIKLANDNKYGLSAVVYGNDTLNVANRLRLTHGLVLENRTVANGFNPHLPWGGFKNSGWIWEWDGNDFKIRDGPKLFSLEFSRGK